ncbi:MAG TPA: COX15/CtaA family protein [Anaerolineales bacterium]|nr:COX15/CtaA family protein [Anaerolineales bacterium]
MPQTYNRAVMNWLFIFTFIVGFLVVFGGFVRLTRAGLSIVEWNPVSGALPPMGEAAWQQEFIKYQQTPEFKQVNLDMTLEEYQYIFYIEWIHRFVARLAGLAYAIPVFYFLSKKAIPFKEFGVYFVMGMLFIAQAFAGWIMVASGLVDRPSVSHFNLTVHLLLALTLLGLALWTALGHKHGFPGQSKRTKWSLPSRLALASFILLVIQIAYGGMTAGLKAGHVSDSWPLMFGRWIPPNLFNSWINLLEVPQTIVFIHRWFAWLGVIALPLVYYFAKRQNYPREILNGLLWLAGAVALQITLGVLTILSYVDIVVALVHQANALVLFALGIYFIHRLRALDRAWQPS